jgi:hypothetical protein
VSELARAQIALEFVFIIFILLSVFSMAVLLNNQHRAELTSLASETSAMQLCRSTAAAIDKIYISGDRVSAQLDIPFSMHFSPEKTISVADKELVVFCSFQAELSRYSFDILPGARTVQNNAGVVEIS